MSMLSRGGEASAPRGDTVSNSYLCDGPASTGAADYREMKREC